MRGFIRQNFLKKNLDGFTLPELLVVIVVLVLITGAVYSSHRLSEHAYREAEFSIELIQNGRVILERMSREFRQAKAIVTELAADETGATSTIMFQDGHNINVIRYIRYFKEGNSIKRDVSAFYFSGDPSVFVLWNAAPPPGQGKLTTTTEEARVIGEYTSDLKFWGTPLINITISLEKINKNIELRTKVFGRNL